MTKTEALCALWTGLFFTQPPQKARLILAFGCNDLNIARRAAQFYREGWADRILFSGGLGKGTAGYFQQPEAEVFREVAIREGVPAQNIWVENRSTNTGENIAFSRALLHRRGIDGGTVLVVHRPTMGRRILASLEKQWPDPAFQFVICPENVAALDHLAALLEQGVSEEEAICNMLGDFERLETYYHRGFQSRQALPELAWRGFYALKAMGYTRYLENP